jgi:hypothetical protein
MAVIVILGIVSVSAEAIFTGFADYRLDVTAKKIVSDLRFAQELAMDTHGSYRISFDVGADRYTVYSKNSTTVPTRDPFTGQDFIVVLNQDLFQGVGLQSATFGGGSFFVYDSKGAPSSGGTIVLSSGGKTRTVSVVGGTGVVRIL